MDLARSAAADRRTVGVIGLLSGERKILKAYYFRLQREFDRTGIFTLGEDVALGRHESDGVAPAEIDKPYKLRPDSEYVVRMATLSVDDPRPDDDSPSDAEIAKRLPDIENIQDMLLGKELDDYEVTFRTFPDKDSIQDKVSFLLGSCRYPGLLWKIKEADRIFGPMLSHFDSGPDAARFTLMIGDQVYADTLNRLLPVGRADTYEEFQERYQTAFGSPNMRRLLRTSPTYMMLDDHEIEDNWTQDQLRDAGKHRLFNYAIGAYMSYEWSHSPRTWGRLLYYKFDCGGYPFFVLDTRTQRFKDDAEGLEDNHMLGRPQIDRQHLGQLQQLLNWLSDQQKLRGNVPKFIGSSSVFAPNAMDERLSGEGVPNLFRGNEKRRGDSDSWPAYPRTRQAILQHIVDNHIENVVFLTGDIHCANIARMEIEVNAKQPAARSLGLHLYDITSSAFYWPFPFADGDPNNYVHDSRAPGQFDVFPLNDGEMHYTSWAYTQEDNFCRIYVDRPTSALTVQYFDRNGKLLGVTGKDEGYTDTNVLPLARW